MRVRIDARLAEGPADVAREVVDRLVGHAIASCDGTIYLGTGSADLVTGSDPAPHVIVPLSTNALIDAVSRAQIAHADAVVMMDRVEARRLGPLIASAPVVIVAEGADDHGVVIHTANPFDAVEVEAFLALSPHIAAYLLALELDIRPFDSRPIVAAIAEAVVLVALDSPQ